MLSCPNFIKSCAKVSIGLKQIINEIIQIWIAIKKERINSGWFLAK
jgi:hypothetical protein